MSYRFRVGEKGELVLQVREYATGGGYYGLRDGEPKWRDATVSDIPVTDPFARPPSEGMDFVQAEPDGPIVRVR